MANKRKKEWMSLPSDDKQLQDLFLKGARHPAMKMADIAMKMNRSPNQAFILLVGLSGAGKSSTVNYLFETDIAETSTDRSETRSTIEYTVKLKSTEWRIPDLKLSIIDTPGFCDTDGLEQDAKNISSIKKFLESHPQIKHRHPNLVMIILNIQDNRIEGESSNFAKMLKGISQINAIDLISPNVVVILTHATSIARNAKIWEEKVEMKKAQVQAIVNVHLGINPEVVVQENRPKDNDLKEDGDWYLLPNGDKQPKILYQACERVLNRTKDEIGHEALAVCFRPGNTSVDKKVRVGMIIASSDVKQEDSQAMYAILIQSIELCLTSEIDSMFKKYKEKKKVKSLENDVLILQVKFRGLGISTTKELQSMSMQTLRSKLHPTKINPGMQTILQEVFGISDEQMRGFDYLVGKGYNIFKDSVTQCSPLAMQDNDKAPYGLPANVFLENCSSFEIKCYSIKDTNEYVTKRLGDLKIHVDGDVNFKAFSIQLEGGYSSSSESSDAKAKTSDKSSFCVEQRIQKVVVKQPFKITTEFKNDVKALPENYDLKDQNNVLQWKAFFDKWGMYAVTGAFIGGSLTGQIQAQKDQSSESSTEDARVALGLKMSYLQRVGSADFSKNDKNITMKKTLSTFHSTYLNWSGGDRKYYKTSLESIDRNDWKAWVESLEYSPVPLLTSLDLYPLYHLVSEVSQTKGTNAQRAMNLALSGKFTAETEKEDNRSTTAESNESEGCFHEDSLVMLHNQKLRRMKDLSVGDKILTMDSNGRLVGDEVIAWIHQVRNGQFTFLQIVHDLGKITMTPEHIIFVGKSRNPQQASSLKPGDELSVFTNYDDRQTLTIATVLCIKKIKRMGIYAPLTYSGRLLVDKVDVSCYCTINPLQLVGKNMISSHAISHALFFPLRMAFSIGLNISTNRLDDESGIHDYARWLMKVILGE